MSLTEKTIKDFTSLLASDAPAPGGGSAAALAGSLGVALTHMVAALTMDKKVYEDHQELMKEILSQAEGIHQVLADMIDKDTEAFTAFSEAMALPKNTDEYKAARTKTMQAALKRCTLVPFEIMQCSFSAIELTERAVGKSNTNAVSDLGVAALLLKAAIQSSWLNILINLGSVKDKEFAKKYFDEGKKILEAAVLLADRIYSDVLKSIS